MITLHAIAYFACLVIIILHSQFSILNWSKGKSSCDFVEMIGLLGVGLIERLGADLETEVFHLFEDMVVALEDEDVLVADSVVALLVVKIH